MYLQSTVVLVLSIISLGDCVAPSAVAKVPDGVRVAAVIPTKPGQIGINPVDIPPQKSILAPIGVDTAYLTQVVSGKKTTTSWHAKQTDFGTATITTTGKNGKPTPTAIPKGFKVTLTSSGKVEITLSKYLKDALKDIGSKVPSCALKARSERGRHPHEDAEKRATATVECVRLRAGRIAEELRQRPDIMRQMVNLNEEVARVTGNDAVALADSGRMMSFAEEGVVVDIIKFTEVTAVDGGAALATLGDAVMGVFASITFWFAAIDHFLEAWKIQANAKPPIKFVKVSPAKKPKPDKTKPKPKPDKTKPKPTPSSSKCPTHKLACSGNRCSGSAGKCTKEWKKCPCLTSGTQIADTSLFGADWAAVEKEISQYVFGNPDPSKSRKVPPPKCTSTKSGDHNLANMESKVWSRLLDKLCVDKKDLSGGFKKTMKTSDIGETAYKDWTFDFNFDTKRKNACTAYSCMDVFGKFASCDTDSHTKYATGEIHLDCGTARYAMHNPAKKTPPKKTPPKKPSPKTPPKTQLKMQNGICFDRNKFDKPAFDVHEGDVKRNAKKACKKVNGPIKAGNADTSITFWSKEDWARQRFRIFWKEGCKLENGLTEMSASNPLKEKNPSDTKCQDILFDNYKRCNNGGIGGSIQAGCLVYESQMAGPK